MVGSMRGWTSGLVEFPQLVEQIASALARRRVLMEVSQRALDSWLDG